MISLQSLLYCLDHYHLSADVFGRYQAKVFILANEHLVLDDPSLNLQS